MNGYGKLFYQNNSIAYDGNWKMDMFYGSGTVYNDHPVYNKGPLDYRDLNQIQD